MDLTPIPSFGAARAWRARLGRGIALGVRVQQPPNHPLVLRIVLRRFALEKLDAALAQREGDFDALIAKCEVLRCR